MPSNRTLLYVAIVVAAVGVLLTWHRGSADRARTHMAETAVSARPEAASGIEAPDSPRSSRDPKAQGGGDRSAGTSFLAKWFGSTKTTEPGTTPAELPSENGAPDDSTTLTDAASTQETCSVSGTVVDENGNPLPEADVVIEGRYGTQTDSAGRFEFHNVTPMGLARVTAWYDGYSDLTMTIMMSAGSESVLNFRMYRGGWVEGTVYDAATGSPVTTFDIGVFRGMQAAYNTWMEGAMRRVTSPTGRFRLPRSSCRSTVVARAVGYTPAFVTLDCGDTEVESMTADVPLEPGRIVKGQVVDAAGNGIPDARIFLGSVPLDRGNQIPSLTTTDDGGNFVLGSLTPNDVSVSAVHATYGTATVPIPPDADTVLIVLAGQGRIEGRVTEDGRPVTERAYVSTRHKWNQQQPLNADGAYAFEDVAPGLTRVCVTINASSPPGYGADDPLSRTMTQEVVVEPGKTARLDFAFDSRVSSLEGNVTIAGVPAVGEGINAIVLDATREEDLNVDIGANGAYRFANLPAGLVRLHVTARHPSGYVAEKNVMVEIGPGQSLRQDIQVAAGGTIQGHVTGIQGGQFAAALFPADIDLPDQITRSQLDLYHPYNIKGLAIGGSGDFLMENIEPGTYLVHIAPFNYYGIGGDALLPFAKGIVEVKEGEVTPVELTIQQP